VLVRETLSVSTPARSVGQMLGLQWDAADGVLLAA